MSDTRDDDRLAAGVKQALDRTIDRMPSEDRLALARARAAAVAAAAADTDRGGGFAWRPAAGLALAASLVLTAVLVLRTPPEAVPGADADKDFEMLVSGEEIQLYEDLDFYLWLDALDGAA